MKINIIIPFTCLTGGIRVIFLYGNYLVSKGHEVEFYVPMKAYKFQFNILKRIKFSLGNTLKRGTRVNWFNCKFKINLVPQIKSKYIDNADIVIATAWPTAYDVYKLDKNKGKKVYFIQGYEIWSGNKLEVDNSYRLDLNRIVITKQLRDKLKESFDVESKVIYNGLFEYEFIKEKKVENKKISILMLYNMQENKGTEQGIELLKDLKKKYDIEVSLFGFKKGNNIPSNFKFYENLPRDEIINLYRRSDIYLFPSKQESWGLPVIEAMANKCAVVGNNVGALKEIGINNVNSIIIDNFDYYEMEKKVIELMKDRTKLKLIQENGYETVKKFSWDNSFYEFEKYLINLLY